MAQNTVEITESGGLLQINDNLNQAISYDRNDLRLTRENPNSAAHEIVTLRRYSNDEYFFSLNTLDLRDGSGNSFANKTLAIAYIEGLLGNPGVISGSSTFNSTHFDISAGTTQDCDATSPAYVTVENGPLGVLNLIAPWSGVVENIGPNDLVVQRDGSLFSPTLELAPGESAMVSYNTADQTWTYTVLNRGAQVPVLEFGVFTPAITDQNSSITSASQLSGVYQRIGNIVYGSLSGSIQANGSGSLIFSSSLPVPNAGAEPRGSIVMTNSSNGDVSVIEVGGTGEAGVTTGLGAAATYSFVMSISYVIP